MLQTVLHARHPGMRMLAAKRNPKHAKRWCSRYPSACVTSCTAMLICRARLCACSCGRWSNACARTVQVQAPQHALSAVAFIHHFGSTLNAHLYFHCVVIDGVFDAATTRGIIFTAATGVDANAIAQVQAGVRRRLARAPWCGVACCRAMMHGQWRNGNMAAGFPWTPRCVSKPLTAPGASEPAYQFDQRIAW